MSTLTEIRLALEREIADPGKFHFVNTRLILTTGINLNQIGPEEDIDPKRVAMTETALIKMGLLAKRSEGEAEK